GCAPRPRASGLGVSDYVRTENRRNLPGLAHGASLRRRPDLAQGTGRSRPIYIESDADECAILGQRMPALGRFLPFAATLSNRRNRLASHPRDRSPRPPTWRRRPKLAG